MYLLHNTASEMKNVSTGDLKEFLNKTLVQGVLSWSNYCLRSCPQFTSLGMGTKDRVRT